MKIENVLFDVIKAVLFSIILKIAVGSLINCFYLSTFRFPFLTPVPAYFRVVPNYDRTGLKCHQKKSLTLSFFLSLYSLYYAEAWNELAGPISASLRPGNAAPFEEMSQRWRAVGNTVSDLTGLRFEPQTSRSRDERVTARPTGRSIANIINSLIDTSSTWFGNEQEPGPKNGYVKRYQW